jgi:signal transduction histidine kinase
MIVSSVFCCLNLIFIYLTCVSSYQSCAAMKTIMDDTLDYAKIEAGEFQVLCAPNSLRQMVENTVFAMQPFAKDPEKNVELSFKIDNDIPEACLFDRGRIQQITANLISNAIKFVSHDGMGKVDVSVENLVDGEDVLMEGMAWQNELKLSADVGTKKKDFFVPSSQADQSISLPTHIITEPELRQILASGCTPLNTQSFKDPLSKELQFETMHCTVLLKVKDNGVGISSADMQTLFQEFRQLNAGLVNKQSGSGLGLAICREIVTLHKGRVGVRSSGIAGETKVVCIHTVHVITLN